MDPITSITDVVQMAGRALRLTGDEDKMATVYVPVLEEVSDTAHGMLVDHHQRLNACREAELRCILASLDAGVTDPFDLFGLPEELAPAKLEAAIRARYRCEEPDVFTAR